MSNGPSKEVARRESVAVLEAVGDGSSIEAPFVSVPASYRGEQGVNTDPTNMMLMICRRAPVKRVA